MRSKREKWFKRSRSKLELTLNGLENLLLSFACWNRSQQYNNFYLFSPCKFNFNNWKVKKNGYIIVEKNILDG